MTNSTIAEVEALRREMDECQIKAEGHTREFTGFLMRAGTFDKLCKWLDFWLAAHREASAGILSVEDTELCRQMQLDSHWWGDKAAARIKALNLDLGKAQDCEAHFHALLIDAESALAAANERAEAMGRELRERNDQVIDWCNVLDKAGEAFQFDPSKPEDQGAADYFCTVSKNAGLARLVCEESNAAIAAQGKP